MITKLKECRVCGKDNLEVVLDLGEIYPSGFYREGDDISKIGKVPLVLCKCGHCGLVQLKHTIELDLMYREYWYASSLNKSMVSSLNNVVNDVESRIRLDSGDVVVDIGANDCTMLQMYSNKEIRTIGFDPALNLKKSECSEFVNDYFTAEKYSEITSNKAKVITAIAMFYDLPDPIKFTKDVKSILHEDGIFVIQFTDLVSMFKVTAFDNICLEHLEYYRLEDVRFILENCGLEIIDVSYNDVNGGSLRVTASHTGRYKPSENVRLSLINEFNYLSNYAIKDFEEKIGKIKFKVLEFLKWVKDQNKTCYLLGASTKGNTLLQVCQVTSELVPYAAEVNKDKFGMKTLGSNIEILSENEVLIKHPNFLLVPIWHFKNNILNNKSIIDYLNSGGSLVFPLPEFSIVSSGHNNKLIETRI